jgi:hypothetical protein
MRSRPYQAANCSTASLHFHSLLPRSPLDLTSSLARTDLNVAASFQATEPRNSLSHESIFFFSDDDYKMIPHETFFSKLLLRR